MIQKISEEKRQFEETEVCVRYDICGMKQYYCKQCGCTCQSKHGFAIHLSKCSGKSAADILREKIILEQAKKNVRE